MSAELTLQAAIAFLKGGASLNASFPSSFFDVAGGVGTQQVASIGTADEVLPLGDISTIGFVFLRNLDATNFITIGSDGTLYPIKLKPNEFFLGRWNAAAIHAKANTAPCNLESLILPD